MFRVSFTGDLLILLPFLEDLAFGFFFFLLYFLFSLIFISIIMTIISFFPAYFGFNLLLFKKNSSFSSPPQFYWDNLIYNIKVSLYFLMWKFRSLACNLSLFLIYAFRIMNSLKCYFSKIPHILMDSILTLIHFKVIHFSCDFFVSEIIYVLIISKYLIF